MMQPEKLQNNFFKEMEEIVSRNGNAFVNLWKFVSEIKAKSSKVELLDQKLNFGLKF